MPEDIAIRCNTIAGLLVLVAFLAYNLKDSRINTGTWIILAFGDSLDLASYFVMTEEWWKSIVPAAFAIGSIATFLIGLARRRFSWPDPFDWFIVTLDFLIIGVWTWQEASATALTFWSHEIAPPAVANLALQATAIIAFVPMYRALLKGREQERPIPWLLWGSAFVLFSGTSILTVNSAEEVAYPLIGLVTHGLVAAFALGIIRPLRT
ncbi:MAG TPA: hypothetical protein VNU25_02730 [Candidatus Paceibacterota bacterium]|nr:hypothetical protein [Candidatus Paceibacterota bacterium]